MVFSTKGFDAFKAQANSVNGRRLKDKKDAQPARLWASDLFAREDFHVAMQLAAETGDLE